MSEIREQILESMAGEFVGKWGEEIRAEASSMIDAYRAEVLREAAQQIRQLYDCSRGTDCYGADCCGIGTADAADLIDPDKP